MRIKKLSIYRGPDGKYQSTEEFIEMPDDELARATQRLAEANPGEIAVGIRCKRKGESAVQIVKLLQELADPNGHGETPTSPADVDH